MPDTVAASAVSLVWVKAEHTFVLGLQGICCSTVSQELVVNITKGDGVVCQVRAVFSTAEKSNHVRAEREAHQQGMTLHGMSSARGWPVRPLGGCGKWRYLRKTTPWPELESVCVREWAECKGAAG